MPTANLSDFIGEVKPVVREAKSIVKRAKAARAKAPKKEKEKACQDCNNFQFFKNWTDNQLYSPALLPAEKTKTIVFIMSPLDFENLERLSWVFILKSGLQEYNLLFLPYPKCFRHAFDDKIATTKTLKYCTELFIDKYLVKYNPDLMVVFPDTKEILEIKLLQEIKFPGNWGKYKYWKTTDSAKAAVLLPVFNAKSLYSTELKGFSNDSFQHAVIRINKYFKKELTWQKPLDFKAVTTLEDLLKVMEEVTDQDEVTLDVETSGLDVLAPGFRLKTIGIYWFNKARCLGYEVEECTNQMYQEKVKIFITELLKTGKVKKICHNLKYEMKVYFAKWGKDLEFNNCEDTQFRSNLLNENRPSHSLKWLAGEYLDGYESTPEDFLNSTLTDLWFYNCLDCYYTYKLYMGQLDFDQEPHAYLREGLQNIYYTAMLPLCYELALLEVNGVKFDYEYSIEFAKKLRAENDATIKRMEEEYPQMRGRNMNSPKQVGDVLFTILKFPVLKMTEGKNPVPSTDSEVMKDLAEKHNCGLAKYILEYKKKEKQLSTFVLPYIENRALYYDDRIRSNYLQTKNNMKGVDSDGEGAASGRLSSFGPNLQNISRDKGVKRQFTATTKNRILVQLDESQAELRIGASLAFEENMLQVYREGGDVHWKTGLRLAGGDAALAKIASLAEEEQKKIKKEWRQNGKPANFGLEYGGSWKMLQATARYKYNVNWTDEEAKTAVQVFFELYPAFLPWHESVEAFASQHGYVVSPLGRVRRAPDILKLRPGTMEFDAIIRTLINAPVQGTCADILAEIWSGARKQVKKLKIDAVAFPVLTVHDSLVWDCTDEEEQVNDLIYIHKGIMKKISDHYQQTWLRCPMLVDAAVGYDWGSMKELKQNEDYVKV